MNNETKHTAGEWKIEGKHGSRHWITSDNTIIAEVLNNPSVSIDEESEANARLIAAAPELLSNCMATLEDLESGSMKENSETYQMAIENLRAAIRKAIHG